ncbi:hypothetical protein KSP40_PGU021911 [Platanthera guangdongensis]|uniref:Uncharacterized protein n=1 Tax=Platanthera guangdongensis TaxID=2320717 RepID=A0ABR2LVY5_9ASPA
MYVGTLTHVKPLAMRMSILATPSMINFRFLVLLNFLSPYKTSNPITRGQKDSM